MGNPGGATAKSVASRVAGSQPAAFKRIAAAVGSAWELPVLAGAIRVLARRRRSRVLVVRVCMNPLTAEIFPESSVRRDIESPAEAQALAEEAVRQLRRAGVTASSIVMAERTAMTSDQVVHAAVNFHADLLVICSRGLTDLRGLIEGSVSHQILRKAPCPILCLPDGLPQLSVRSVVLAWDGSPAARSALSVAGRVARVHGATLAAIHIVRDAAQPGRLGLPAYVSLAEVRERAGGVADTLNEAAHAAGADLVVMGSHGRGDLAAMVLGSVTHRLLAISERPILVVRDR